MPLRWRAGGAVAEVLDASALARWRREPISFIEQVLRNPETGRPFELLDAQRQFFEHAWQTNEDGRLLYPEQCYGAIKKSGKTATAAMHLLATTLLYGGRFAEGYAIANDLEQAQGRVFQAVRRIVEVSPYLCREANITQYRIDFPQTGATIQALGSDYAGAAGANPVCSSFDELWAYTSERSRRLYDEMVPSPARKISCRLITTYAGFEDESTLLLELYKRGLQQQQLAPGFYAGDGLLMAWHHEPLAPWQTEAWLTEMRRSLRPAQYLRMIENRFVASGSSFIDMSWWDACVHPDATPCQVDRTLQVWVGVDASVKRDSTAIVAVSWDRKYQHARLVWHRIYQPSAEDPMDFERVIEATLLDLKKRFRVRKVWYDPYQMHATAQRLARAGLKLEEFPQTVPNLTEAAQNLFELIKGSNLVAYADPVIRLAVSRAIAAETARGWRIAKDKQAHKIDVVIALAMAALAAIRGQAEPYYDLDALAS